MPTHPEESPRPLTLSLPDRPNLRHLKDQAKELLKAGGAASLADAQLQIARQYGFESWPKLKTHVDLLTENGQLKAAIDTNNLEEVKRLMTRNPALHRAPLGYGKNGPLTWVAECRVPWEAPGAVRLEMAQWMIDSGSDVHQGGDGPLMRAALVSARIPMMELLVRNGADVNARWNGYFPIIFAPCETVEPAAIKWLLEHGADPNCAEPGRKHPDNALDYVIGTYSRSPQLAECIDMLLNAGCVSRRDVPPVLDMLRGRMDLLAAKLDAEPGLVHRRWPELDWGSTAYRRMTLHGGTLLHVAAEYGNVEAARMLLERGADVNARVEIDENGIGGRRRCFTQFRSSTITAWRWSSFLLRPARIFGCGRRFPGITSARMSLWSATRWSTARCFRARRTRRLRLWSLYTLSGECAVELCPLFETSFSGPAYQGSNVSMAANDTLSA